VEDNKPSRIRFAQALLQCYIHQNIIIKPKLSDRTWIFIHQIKSGRPETDVWKALPAGVAILMKRKDPHQAYTEYQKAVEKAGWSYEQAAEDITGIPKQLLIDANKAHLLGLSIEEMCVRLLGEEPLVRTFSGKRIIDLISDPGSPPA
jgi:hypothetical protein